MKLRSAFATTLLAATVYALGLAQAQEAPRAEVGEAADGLLEQLRSGDKNARTAAFRELLKKGKRAGPVLLEAAQSPPSAVQVVAVQMLAELGVKEAVPTMVGFVESGDSVLRQTAIQGLGRLKDARAAGPLLDRLGRVSQRAEICALASALGAIGDGKAAPALRERLTAEDKSVQACAAGALGMLGDRSGLDLALELVNDDNARVRRAAIEALGSIGDERGVPVLREIAEDPDSKDRDPAQLALRQIQVRDKPKKDKVRFLRQDLDGDELVQDWAARELAAIGDPEAVAALKEKLRDEKGRVRRPILVQLYKLGVKVEGKALTTEAPR